MSDHNKIKLDINNKIILRKYSNTWKSNNAVLKIQLVTKVIREEFKKFLESNENENTTYQNLWNTSKTVKREKIIAISAYI
jgi:hypothetical protein